MAAPHVTGTAAVFKAKNPHPTPQQIIDMTLKSSSQPTTTCHWVTSQGDAGSLKKPLLFREPPLSRGGGCCPSVIACFITTRYVKPFLYLERFIFNVVYRVMAS
jgi:hypothetical protein